MVLFGWRPLRRKMVHSWVSVCVEYITGLMSKLYLPKVVVAAKQFTRDISNLQYSWLENYQTHISGGLFKSAFNGHCDIPCASPWRSTHHKCPAVRSGYTATKIRQFPSRDLGKQRSQLRRPALRRWSHQGCWLPDVALVCLKCIECVRPRQFWQNIYENAPYARVFGARSTSPYCVRCLSGGSCERCGIFWLRTLHWFSDRPHVNWKADTYSPVRNCRPRIFFVSRTHGTRDGVKFDCEVKSWSL